MTKKEQERNQKDCDTFLQKIWDIIESIEQRIKSEECSRNSIANTITQELMKKKPDEKVIEEKKIKYKECEARMSAYNSDREDLRTLVTHNRLLLTITAD